MLTLSMFTYTEVSQCHEAMLRQRVWDTCGVLWLACEQAFLLSRLSDHQPLFGKGARADQTREIEPTLRLAPF